MNNFNNETGSEDVAFLKYQLSVARSEISNLRHQLKSLKHTYRKDCDEIRSQLENWRCLECRNKPVESTNVLSLNNVPVDLSLQYIGTISTVFPEKRGTPRQPAICSNTIGKLTLNNQTLTNPEHALEGLQEYSHMWILFHFHKNDSNHTHAKVAPPRLNGIRTGVFATRSPHRPSPIGLSLVKIDRIIERVIYFSGVDMVDQTPVLDIKPYIPNYDNPDVLLENLVNALDISVIDSMERLENININTTNGQENHLRVMDGEENGERAQAVVGSITPIRDNSVRNIEETYHDSRSVSRIGEREAPDGEEEEPPHQQITATTMIQPNTANRQIRVPTWVEQPPVSTLNVNFKQRALLQLQQLGSEGEAKKSIIMNVLQEDPRSVYLRERMDNSSYVFRIAELYVSCKFDDATHVVTVFQVFQDSVPQADE